MTSRKLRPKPPSAAAKSSTITKSAVPSRTKLSAAEIKSFIDAHSEFFDIMNKKNASGYPVISCYSFSMRLHRNGVGSLLKTGSTIWQHGPADQIRDQPVPDEVEAFGAQLCSSQAGKFQSLEALISDRTKAIQLGYLPRNDDNKVDRQYLIEYDQARFEYRSLLLEIILDKVNAERHENDPDTSGLSLSKTQPLQLDDKIIEPHDSSTIYDQDLETPAMTLYLPSDQAATSYTLPLGSNHSAFRAEIPLQMKLNKRLSYQGLAFGGLMARVTCARVARLSDNLAFHKTEFNSALYVFPSQRNVFVADMVKLLQNHTDWRQVYTNSIPSAFWNSRKKAVQYVDYSSKAQAAAFSEHAAPFSERALTSLRA